MKHILFEKKGSIGIITLNSPKQRNALSLPARRDGPSQAGRQALRGHYHRAATVHQTLVHRGLRQLQEAQTGAAVHCGDGSEAEVETSCEYIS